MHKMCVSVRVYVLYTNEIENDKKLVDQVCCIIFFFHFFFFIISFGFLLFRKHTIIGIANKNSYTNKRTRKNDAKEITTVIKATTNTPNVFMK